VTFVETEAERAVRVTSEVRDRALSLTPETKRARGVVHTPGRLARFVARRADELLRAELGIARGLADPRVTIVDPACGTGAFLAAALSVVEGRKGAPAALVGFDVDEEAVESCRIALDGLASARGTRLHVEARNTLESLALPLESEAIVVLGNPPWAGKSANADVPLAATLLDDFRRTTGGEPLGEKKAGVLSDDYVRFLRWSAEICRRAKGAAVLGLVTNGSYLDGPVHRGVRAALLRWFSDVEVFDLGGSALLSKGEVRDENVFGVRPSVACTFAVRRRGHGELVESGRLRYARLFGSREEKLDLLAAKTPITRRIAPRPPLLAFDLSAIAADFPDGWVSLDEIFPFHREGVQTNRDDAVVAPDEATLRERLQRFVAGEPDPALEKARAERAHYDPERARRAVEAALRLDDPDLVRRLAYRPFDDRVFCALREICHRPRPDLAEAMRRSSFALLSVRKDRGEAEWNHFAVSREIPDNCYFSNRSSCRTRAFPTHTPDGSPNVSPRVSAAITERTGALPSADEVALYVLATLASSTYRTRFQEALRADYPRIPLPRGKESFVEAVRLGEALRAAWLGPRASSAEWRVGHHRIREKPEGLDGVLAACDASFRAEWGELCAWGGGKDGEDERRG